MVLFADLNEQDFSRIHAPIDDLEYRQGDAFYAEAGAAQAIFTLHSGRVNLVLKMRNPSNPDISGLFWREITRLVRE